MSLEAKAKIVQQIIDDNIGILTLLGKPEKANSKWVRLEVAQKEIQNCQKRMDEACNSWYEKNKVLEGKFARIRSLIKEFPIKVTQQGLDLTLFTTPKLSKDEKKIIEIVDWFLSLEKELKT
jgi:hypothetical protein